MTDARALLAGILRADLPAVDAATPLSTLKGFDSIGMVSLVLKLEAAITRELTESELESLTTIGDVDRLLGAA